MFPIYTKRKGFPDYRMILNEREALRVCIRNTGCKSLEIESCEQIKSFFYEDYIALPHLFDIITEEEFIQQVKGIEEILSRFENS